MVGIVRIALKRPYTFVVLAIFILIVGVLSAFRTPTDIFPDINIPVIAVIWQYTGLPPDQMEGRVMAPFERVLTTTVNDVQHIEGRSVSGYGVVKIFFQKHADIRTANAQVTSIAQYILKQLPPGATPPLIVTYSASTVPIVQLALSGDGLTEQNLGDLGLNQLRPILTTVEGASLPYPYGGKTRQVQINVKAAELEARGLSAQDVANALAAQNLITPVGTEKIGGYEYIVQLNSAPASISGIANIPIKSANGTTVYMRDVADVTDGSPPQTNIVHVDGKRSVLLTVLKNGSVSTLAIIAGVKQKVADAKASLPDNLKVDVIGDQSVFVRAAISGVAREGVIAAVLTSLMILLFLGSWRSTVIIATSIPLAILGSIAALSALGETLNIMTLGGLALAVGILVDDATVTIENINWHLEQGKAVENAILDGAAQIVTPAFVSLLCICIVFVPMFFLDGVARFLFVPMAEAVMFAMISSFILSRTLVPTMAKYLLKPHAHADSSLRRKTSNPLARFQYGFEARFERIRTHYSAMLEAILERRGGFALGFFAFAALSLGLVPFLGRNFFPDVDAGEILMHVRAPVGTRVEQTAAIFAAVERQIQATIPPTELGAMVDNMGLSTSGLNTAYNNTGTIGSQDGDIEIALKDGHRPTANYVRKLRETLPQAFPGVTFSFPPADIVSQILNFGTPGPIDLQIRGGHLPADFAYADRLLRQIRHIPGIADVRIAQSQGNPQFDVEVDRTQALLQGVTERDITNSLLVHMAGSGQVAPTYWLNAANGVEYPIVLQTPQYGLNTLPSLANLPIGGGPAALDGEILGGVATIRRTASNAVVDDYNIQPMVEIDAATQGRDLGAVASDLQRIVAANASTAPKGAKVVLLGQVQTMNSAFSGMLFGLVGAVVLIYLLIVVNFQSWTDPLVIVTALPLALAGIVWMLYATHTPMSVPALTGAIMCMGVATANSILVVSFCRERLAVHGDAVKAALEAGTTRFRPVLMTALSMMIGMAPMALSLGEGGEQNAPLGRAVIGGLLFATTATLFLVPAVFCIAHSRPGRDSTYRPLPEDPQMPDEPTPPARPRRVLSLAGMIGAAVALAILAAGSAVRAKSNRQLEHWTEAHAIPTIKVIEPIAPADGGALDLPGRLESFTDAPIYARVNGYLKSWRADIGDHVKAGQVLATIDTPELDQQLLQARADLTSAQADAALAKTSAERWQALLGSDSVSRQEVDDRTQDYAQKRARVAAAQANVDRLVAMKAFATIVAPFDGIVTARNTDIGALIDAGSSSHAQLFSVSSVDRLRVYVHVPQPYAPMVKPGGSANFTVPEYPGQRFTANVVGLADAVNASSGTTLVQLQVDNPGHRLLPGSFVRLHFELPVPPGTMRIPASALIFDERGLRVATVDSQNEVRFKSVAIEQDLGNAVEIGSGLHGSDRVIDTPPDGLGEGDRVRVTGAGGKAANHG